MANEQQRARGGIIVLTEDDKLYIIPMKVLDDHKLEYVKKDKGSLIDNLLKTGRLKNLKAARQIEPTLASQDVSLFGGVFPDPGA